MIAIIQYDAGNTASVRNAVERLGYEVKITARKDELLAADKIILPGVGAAGSAMTALKRTGLHEIIPMLTQPFLGICLGMQLLCKQSEEDDTIGLGVFNTVVKKFPAAANVPHTGWNNLYDFKSNLLNGVAENADVYFVHSYYAELSKETVASCHYIHPFAAVVQKENFYGTQFHPEKSGLAGELILKNFLALPHPNSSLSSPSPLERVGVRLDKS
ncbi:MAG: imidazole glycerol phosphate synthase subunit HisH [Ferruginibacter sp.]